jgi:hypothetical protein
MTTAVFFWRAGNETPFPFAIRRQSLPKRLVISSEI